jgi:NADH-quinone oxidoreductase subunit N
VTDVATSLLNSFNLVIPEAVLGVAACVAFLGGTFRANRNLWGGFSLAAIAGSALALWLSPASLDSSDAAKTAVFVTPVAADGFARIIRVIALAGGAILVLSSWNEVPDEHAAEYQGCLLVTLAGVGLTGAANDLVTLFLALELVSIPTYVLLYLLRRDVPAQEAAVKYFLLSVFSSALLLLGFSFLYGLAGTTNIPALADALVGQEAGSSQVRLPTAAIGALVLVVAGLGFRITAVPFHFYAPDVYQGTATAGAAFLAFIPKVAGFAGLFRILDLIPHLISGGARPEGMHDHGILLSLQVSTLFWIMAAVTMTLGNVLALLQDNLRRLLAYSSIAHAGYMLVALAATPYLRFIKPDGTPGGVETIVFYLAAYGAMTIGVFAVISYLDSRERPVETVDDLAGLAKSRPGVALLMALFLFSLIGVPLTAGFAGKFLIFFGAVAVSINGPDLASLINPGEPGGWQLQSRLYLVLAFVGVLNAAIGAWYYLRIVAVMYLRTPLRPVAPARNWPGLAALVACGLLTLGLGVACLPVFQATRDAITPPPAVDLRTKR